MSSARLRPARAKPPPSCCPFLNGWRDDNRPGPQALILAPTRELVVQVAEEAAKLSPNKSCRAVPIYGGQRFNTQLSLLKRGCNIAVGSPGASSIICRAAR